MKKVRTHFEVRVEQPYGRDDERVKVTYFDDVAPARLFALQEAMKLAEGPNKTQPTIRLVEVETHEGAPEVFTRDRAQVALLGA